MTSWSLPMSAELGGRTYAVHADYRDILDIISRLNDPEAEAQTQILIVLALFYEDFTEMPETDYELAVRWLFCFINGGKEEANDPRPAPKMIDWEQDQFMIVADINRVACCEIRALPFCHWWTFLAWFQAMGEGQLSTVVSIREKRRKGKKLSDWEKEFYQENRDRVDFRKKYTAEELETQERLKRILGE